MKLRIFILFLFLSLFRAQADVIDSLMTHPRDSIALTSDSLVLRFLSESGIPISDNNKVKNRNKINIRSFKTLLAILVYKVTKIQHLCLELSGDKDIFIII